MSTRDKAGYSSCGIPVALRKNKLREMIVRRMQHNKTLYERSSLLYAYLDFAFDESMSDSVRFRALERLADSLETPNADGARVLNPDTGNANQARCAVETWIADRAQGVHPHAPLLSAFLALAFSPEASDNVRLRALEKILFIVERARDDDTGRDQNLPENIEGVLLRVEAALQGGAATA